MSRFIFAFAGLWLACLNSSAATDLAGGAEIYQRCAVCHLPGGEGIPGAFPPLKNRLAALASSEEGRAYVIMVVKSGLMGPIKVEQATFQGVMPAQLLTDDQIAGVLNYVAAGLGEAPPDWQFFDAQEVGATVAEHPDSTGNKVAEQRRQLSLFLSP